MKYQIIGEPLAVAVCNVEPGETLICEPGAMSWMSGNMKMETSTGGAGLGKMLSKKLSGESIFQNKYTAEGGEGLIAFGIKTAGSIRAYEISPSRSIVTQKGGFLAGTQGIEIGMYGNKNIGAGLAGGEGFIMQKVSGNGTALIEIDGYAVEYNLAPGQKMVIDTGYLAVMDETVTMSVEKAGGGLKNLAFGGEGFFNTTLTGPGTIVLQSMPIASLASSIIPFLPAKS